MTFDHFAKIAIYLKVPWFNENLNLAFTIIGRISFPIFCFLIVQGIKYTHSRESYLVRLLSLSVICDILFTIFTKNYIGNPITTLFLGALTICLYEQKNKILKACSSIPIIICILIRFDLFFIKSDYDLFGLTLIILFYLCDKITPYICSLISSIYQLDKDIVISKYSFIVFKLISCISLFLINIIIYFFNPIINNHYLFIDNPYIEIYSLLSIPFILLYNGKKGYNNKWVKYFFYAYFPIHIAIIYILLAIL